MSTIVTMTLDEILDLPPLTAEDKRRINKAKANPDDDCPAQTEEDLNKFKPVSATHPELYNRIPKHR